ncbi:DUF2599 domain-containing protein [Isoptericola jiangsuensis]|uniref:DUF2599 domain-containing protein n=1 Tax=Isoptericola jiangsuensis TaxID=548579 RepID=UPI003AB0CB6A
MRRPVQILTPAVGVVAVALLAGCAPADDGASAPTSPSAQASPSSPSAADAPSVTASDPPADAVTTGAQADDVRLEVRAGDGAVVAEPEPGSSTVTLDLAQLSPDQDATVTLVSSGELLLRPDGSVTVRSGQDDGGTDDAPADAVAGLTPPDGARFRQEDPRSLVVVPDESSDGRTTGTVTFTLASRGVEATDWDEREGGRSLAVTPTPWARQARTAGVDVVWSELVADDPEVASATMHDQLVCHSIGAPDKATWNLEPWRPDVGLLQVLADRCNPV